MEGILSVIHAKRVMAFSILIMLSVIPTKNVQAEESPSVSNRCAYLYAVASVRMSAVVAGLLNRFDASDEVARANEAAQLSIETGCPRKPMIAAMDCSVQMVMDRGGQSIMIKDGIACVEKSIGKKFPSIRLSE